MLTSLVSSISKLPFVESLHRPFERFEASKYSINKLVDFIQRFLAMNIINPLDLSSKYPSRSRMAQCG